MLHLLQEEPKFAKALLSYTLMHSICVQEDLVVDQLFNSSEKRLARALLLLAHFGKEGKPETVFAKISQETLAEMIGTTRWGLLSTKVDREEMAHYTCIVRSSRSCSTTRVSIQIPLHWYSRATSGCVRCPCPVVIALTGLVGSSVHSRLP